MRVQMYRDVRDTVGQSAWLFDVLYAIRDGRWSKRVMECTTALAEGDKPRYDELKAALPAFTPAGTFRRRGNAHLMAHSGYLVLDYDMDSTSDAWDVFDKAVAIQHTAAAFFSPSMRGVKVVARLWPAPANANEHKEAYLALTNRPGPYSAHQLCMGVPTDPSGKDVARLCFVSSDASMLVNPKVASYEWLKVPNLASASPTRQSKKPDAPPPGKLADAATLLWRIRSDLPGYDAWLEVVSAAKACGISQDEVARWHLANADPSQGRNNSDPATAVITRWNGLPSTFGMGTLYHHAASIR